MKLLHLISDDKFIDSHIRKFSWEGFQNVFLYLKETSTYAGKNSHLITHIRPLSKSYNDYIDLSQEFDGIVTNGLGYYQSMFINRLPATSRIFWCFFGAEIYNNPKIWNSSDLYGPRTKRVLARNWGYFFLRSLYHLRFYFKYRTSMHSEIKKAIVRCDYFLWYIKEEYDLIKSKSDIVLPEFRPLPITDRVADSQISYRKRDEILLGNSGSEANNHIDLLKLLGENSCVYKIKLPVSYGLKNWYKKEMIKTLHKSKLKVDFMESFVPYTEYIQNFTHAKAAIYPSYRQMGLGNIILCILNGVKIYLSERNPVFQWLKNIGVKVFTIEKCLKIDLKYDNFALDSETILENKLAWNKLISTQNENQFRELFSSLLISPNNE